MGKQSSGSAIVEVISNDDLDVVTVEDNWNGNLEYYNNYSTFENADSDQYEHLGYSHRYMREVMK